jgi:hypothetical protein
MREQSDRLPEPLLDSRSTNNAACAGSLENAVLGVIGEEGRDVSSLPGLSPAGKECGHLIRCHD